MLFTICFLLFTIITAVQWVPTLQLILLSARDVDQASWKSPGWFIPWQNLIQFIVPDASYPHMGFVTTGFVGGNGNGHSLDDQSAPNNNVNGPWTTITLTGDSGNAAIILATKNLRIYAK